VITLVYGLGFGMFLVLLVVPALMAIQQDVGRQLRATSRALRARAPAARRIRLAVRAAAAATAAAFVLAPGYLALTGSLPTLLERAMPWASAPAGATALFIAGAAVVAVVTLALAARRPRAPRG
jgi:hypothetical protein